MNQNADTPVRKLGGCIGCWLLCSVAFFAPNNAHVVGRATGSVGALLIVLRKNYGFRVLHSVYLLYRFLSITNETGMLRP